MAKSERFCEIGGLPVVPIVQNGLLFLSSALGTVHALSYFQLSPLCACAKSEVFRNCHHRTLWVLPRGVTSRKRALLAKHYRVTFCYIVHNRDNDIMLIQSWFLSDKFKVLTILSKGKLSTQIAN